MLTAAQLMTTHVRTIRETALLQEALDTLQELDVRHLPVVNEAEEVVGMLSDRDLGRLADIPKALKQTVARVMSSDLVAVGPETELDELISALLENRIGAVPVIDPEQNLVGLVSYVDILRAVARERAEGEALPAPIPLAARRGPAAQKSPRH